MRLKWKIGISIFTVIVVATVINVVVVSLFFQPSFERLDERTAKANTNRATEYFQDESDRLGTIAQGWAHWTETYRFAGDFNQAYRDTYLSPQNLKFLAMAGFAIADDNGVVRFSVAESPQIANLLRVGQPLPKGMFKHVAATGTSASSAEGFVASPIGPLLTSIAPIQRPAPGDPDRGYVVLARLIEPRAQARLHDTAGLTFALKAFHGTDTDLTDVTQAPSFTEAPDVLTADYVLRDVAGQPSYVLSVMTPREFTSLGWLAVKGALIRFVWLSIIFLATVAWLIGRLVTKPLAEMASRMSRIAATGDLDQTLDIKRDDEIGQVADVFNRMIGEIKSARSRLVDQSYSTGMADLAAGILNNVRSAAEPVATANEAAAKLLEKIDTTTLQEVGRELTYAKVDHEQRQKLGAYVNAFAEGTKSRLNELKSEIERIDRSARHIQHILEDHESISRWPRQSVPVDCRQLVQEAARGISGIGEIPIDVEVAHGDGPLPPVVGHAFILRQVIGNLLANSVDAIRHAQRKRGRIHLLTRKATLAGRPAVEIVVGDNGAGFTTMQAEHLFDRGYSTRSDRPGGFGLNWCRDALSAMNATIAAQSPGPGLGATFRVFLPAAEVDAAEPGDASFLEGAA